MKISVATQPFVGAMAELFDDDHPGIICPTHWDYDMEERWHSYDESKLLDADLVIFTGGEDINPTLYGEENRWSAFNNSRDYAERFVFEQCVQFNKKMLGVCRGHQLLNALTGGLLAQDLLRDLGVTHSGGHAFDWVAPEESWIVPQTFRRVNSMHHQAVIRPGTGLTPTSSFRGVIESCESENILTVQFHPEFMNDTQAREFAKRVESWVMKGTAV